MMLLTLALPFLAALLAPWLTRLFGHKTAWLLALAPAAMFVNFFGYLPDIRTGAPVTGGVPWVPGFSVDLDWFLDGLSLTFALLISGIGTLIVLYSGGYLKGHPHQGRFFAFILMFMGSMQGLVVADSFLMLFVFWELTSITSFLLIGFDHSRPEARRAAVQALVVTGMGGLALLAGLLVIWNVTGVTKLSMLAGTGDMLRESPLYIAAFVLILGGAFTKSAQFPLHFWLPNAMEAPTPVSAYLHSATMVKAGVYLLMRLNPSMGGTEAWMTVLPVFGGTTLIVGTLLAVRQTDLKLMLAYTTVASLGLLVMLTGFGTQKAIEGAVLYLVAHSLFKGALFMVAGLVDHETGTRDITALGGLRRAMPVTFAAAMLAALSMGGLPPFFGFLAKEELYYGLAGTDAWSMAFTAIALVGNALMFVIGFAIAIRPFLGEPRETPKPAHEGPALLWIGPLILSVAGLVAALASAPVHDFVSSPMATAVAGLPSEITISVVPHPGIALYLSLATVALGIVLFLALPAMRAAMGSILDGIGWGPDRGFDQAITGLVNGSVLFTRTVQNGRLEFYIASTFALLAAALLVPMIALGEGPAAPAFPELRFYEWTIMAIAVIGLAGVVAAKNRLTAIVSLGIQGFAVAIIFMLMGAPDLSFTQFMVETLSVVILALAMTRLRLSPSDHRPARDAIIDGAIAAGCGVGFGALLLAITQLQFDATLTEFFNTYSKVIAHGHNIVNVIIVDFRGVDTLGEIAVVMITGLAILALIRIQSTARKAAVPGDAS